MNSRTHLASVALVGFVMLVGGGCGCEDTPEAQDSPGGSAAAAADAGTAPDTAATPEPSSPSRETPMARLPEFPSEPPVVAEEDAVVYRGRVVDASGAGVEDVRVRLLGFPQLVDGPVGRPFVWGAARTGHSGRFRLSAPAERGPRRSEFLLVESDTSSRTLEVSDPSRISDVRLSPTATVRVELRCRALYPEQRFRFPRVVGVWPRPRSSAPHEGWDEEVWTSRLLPPEGAAPPDPIIPGLDLSGARSVPAGTDRFAADIMLPRGQRITLSVRGVCGAASQEIEVPETGAMAPIVFSLPDPDAASIEIHLTGASSTPRGRTPYLLDVWADGYSERVALTPPEPGYARDVPPGRVRIGRPNMPRCQRVVEAPRRATTRVEIGVHDCLVFTLPTHL